MLQKEHRIKKEEDILAIRAKGMRERGRFYRIIAKKTISTAPLRIVVVVGIAQAKKATIRNHIRRRTREALRRSMGDAAGYDLVLLPSREVETAAFSDLVKELTHLIHALQDRYIPYNSLAKNPIT